MMWGSWGVGMMLLMFLFWVAMIVAILVAICWLVTAGRHGRGGAATRDTDSALDILQKRYARGEISQEEFDTMRQHLS
jgi:putative membrane protein